MQQWQVNIKYSSKSLKGNDSGVCCFYGSNTSNALKSIAAQILVEAAQVAQPY